MRKIKVSEATGPVLDWMAAKAEGYTPLRERSPAGMLCTPEGLLSHMCEIRYSTDWAQGGPILSKLGAENGLQLTTHVTSTAAACGWRASCDFPNGFYFGETALIAAMRCYVASKLGNEVEVPEGLCHGA